MSQPTPDKVTLEDLLRLKRAERPPVEFWAEFDRELQAKQLAALVEKKPWWHSAARGLRRFSYLPLGATAALAFAFIVAREYRSPVTEISGGNQMRIAQPPVAHATVPAAIASLPQSAPVETHEKIASAVPSESRESHPVTLAAASGISTAISWLVDTLPAAGSMPLSEHSISASFADARITNPAPVSDLASDGGVKASLTADPLTQVSSPSQTQHARLLAALTDVRLACAVDPIAAAHMHQRYATSVGDEGLADDIGRLGVDGSRVSIKF
jgi:hypothetical protein